VKFGSVLSLIAVVIAALAVYGTSVWKDRSGELVNKPEWSVLQSVELAHRAERITQVTPLPRYQGTDWDVVGLPTEDGRTLWMLTNAWGLPQVKTMGATAHFKLSEMDYQLIRSKLDLNDDVNIVLKNAIEADSAAPPLP